MTFLNRVAGLALALMVVAWPVGGRGQEGGGGAGDASGVSGNDLDALVYWLTADPAAAAGGTTGTKTVTPESATLAQFIRAYGESQKIDFQYLPDAARIASSQYVVVGAPYVEKVKLATLMAGQFDAILREANLELIREGDLNSALSNAGLERFIGEGGEKKVQYLGSKDGELSVLRRTPHCKEKAKLMLTLMGGLKNGWRSVVVNPIRTTDLYAQIIKEGQPAGGAAEALRALLAAKIDLRMSAKEAGDLKLKISNDAGLKEISAAATKLIAASKEKLSISDDQVSALLEGYAALYPYTALAKSDVIDYPRAEMTLSLGPAIGVVALRKVLQRPGDEEVERPGMDLEWVPLDKGGRFISSYRLSNVWSSDFEYQRAFATTAAQPGLKVAGLRVALEQATKDYMGGSGISEEASAAAPQVEPVKVPNQGTSEPRSSRWFQAAGLNNFAFFDDTAQRKIEEKGRELYSQAVNAVAGALVNDALVNDALADESESARRDAAEKLLVRLLVKLERTPLYFSVSDLEQAVKFDWLAIAGRSGLKIDEEEDLKASVDAFVKARRLFVIAAGPPKAEEKGAEQQKTSAVTNGQEGAMARALQPVEEVNGKGADARLANVEATVAKAEAQAAKPAEECKKEKEKEEKAPDPPKPAEAYAATPQLRGGAVQADVANNSVMVVVPKTKAAQALKFMDYLERFITDLDQERKMVEISVAIVDTEASIAEQWGVRFAVAARGTVDGRPAFGVSGFQVPRGTGGQPGSFSNILNPAMGVPQIPASTVESTALTQGLNVGALIMGSSVDMLATLRAMEGEGKGRVLSRPSLLTTDNSEAVLSEETKFYLPASGLNTGTLAEVPVGLKVVVTPQIVTLGGPGEKREAVRMRINLKEGTGSGADSITGLPAGVVAVDNSQFKTVAVIEQGQSLMVAGRLRHDEVSGDQRVPVLGKVPLVGRAFKSSSLNKTRQQRMILITPVIVDPATYHHAAAEQAARVFHEPELPRLDPAAAEEPPPPPSQAVKKKSRSSAK